MRQLRIAELRKEHGYTLKELGEKLGVRDNTLSQYETGKRQPQLGFLYELADFFHVSLDYLTGESEIRRFTVNAKEEAINLIQKIIDNKVHMHNLDTNTSIELGIWISENMDFLEEEYPYLVSTAITFLSSISSHVKTIKWYSESRKKEYEVIENIYERITSDDYYGARPDEVLEFIKQSERIEFEEIKNILKDMKELPDRSYEE